MSITPRARALFAVTLAFALTACGDDVATDYVDIDPDPDPAAPARTDCVESDFGGAPLQGPGFADGVYVGPTDAPLVATSTVLYLLDRPGAAERFGALMGDISAELARTEGLLGFALGGSAKCGAYRTLALWRDVDAMMAFVGSEAHTAGVIATPALADRGTRTVRWTFDPASETLDWAVGVERAAAADEIGALGGGY